jgi:aminopeptidase
VTDPHLTKLARVLVHYCLDVERGDLFVIRATPVATPLVTEVYRAALQAGAHPTVQLTLPRMQEAFYELAKKHQLDFVSPVAAFEMERLDKVLTIRAADNTKSLTNADPKKQAAAGKASGGLSRRLQERAAVGNARWCLTQFPCSASAQDAEMSLEEYEDFVFRACLVHLDDPAAAWQALHKRQARLCTFLGNRKTLRVVKGDTDLTVSVAGRSWMNSDGRTNMPSGEVFTGPVEDTVEGTVAFSFPAVREGREVHGVRLTFEKGRVVKATAAKGEEYLHAMLGTDEGARSLGEFAFGTNDSVQRFTKNTLFDEKIGGTIHMALGAAYPKSGGLNRSSIHWDMILDMRDGGEVHADGKVIYRKGKFTHEGAK